jgi:hypothetical protein
LKFPFYAKDTISERLSGGWGLCSGLGADAILITGKHPQRAHARNLACYWAVRELGRMAVAVARLIGITQSL